MLLDMYKFYWSYTGLQKKSQVHLHLLSMISKAKFSAVTDFLTKLIFSVQCSIYTNNRSYTGLHKQKQPFFRLFMVIVEIEFLIVFRFTNCLLGHHLSTLNDWKFSTIFCTFWKVFHNLMLEAWFLFFILITLKNRVLLSMNLKKTKLMTSVKYNWFL